MSSFTTLQLKNQAGTEQNFLVSGIDYQSNVATWLLNGSSYDASRKVTFSLTQPSAKSARARVKVKVVIPIMDPVLTTKKINEIIFSGEFVLPKESTLADRQDLRAYIADYLIDSVVVNAIEKFEAVY